jgi:hypothetical protein
MVFRAFLVPILDGENQIEELLCQERSIGRVKLEEQADDHVMLRNRSSVTDMLSIWRLEGHASVPASRPSDI